MTPAERALGQERKKLARDLFLAKLKMLERETQVYVNILHKVEQSRPQDWLREEEL